MNDYFSSYHPLVQFFYFFIVIASGMFFLHPIYMFISFSAAFWYSVMLKKEKALKFNILVMLPTMLLLSIINPMFNHAGVTILFYLKNGNPFTLESVIYGIVSGAMLINVFLWFSCHNYVMTSDKLMYLFGKLIPSSSLIFSMVLRFVPLYKTRIQTISHAQKGIGNDVTQGNVIQKAKNGIKILSIMMTWALEASIETADSMKARGYGLKGRTAFSHYTWTKRDAYAISLLIIGSITLVVGQGFQIIHAYYLPKIVYTPIEKQNIWFFFNYFVLCYLPIIINYYDTWLWRWKVRQYNKKGEIG